MKRALLSVLTYFLISQILTAIVIGVVAVLCKLAGADCPIITVMTIAYIYFMITGVLVCWKALKVMEIPATFKASKMSVGWMLMALVAAFSGAFAGDLLVEITNMPNFIEDTMMEQLSYSFWGILTVAIVGPIAEELVFREGVCGYLSRNGAKPWKAIWVSAVLFGIIHMNPAQVVVAMIIGIILGVIYIKTGNVVLTSIIHILNNSIALIQMNVMGEKAKDFSMVEWVGGNTIAIICIVVGLALCGYLLKTLYLSPTGKRDLVEN
ncbi:MAG: CPBP family intramembrane metalloprotease [Bacteroidaceae bacterium]|nr:CPBP family intramembrane metalloprotease [Bacteroidaceae bacterium]